MMLKKYACLPGACLLGLILLTEPLRAQQRKESPNFARMTLLATDMNRNSVPGTGIPQVKPGFSFGMGRNIVLARGINLQPGLEYTPRGYRSRRTLTDSTFRRSWNGLHYLDFTMTLGLSFGSYTKFYVDAAPYVAYGFYGKNRVTRQEVFTTYVDSTASYLTRVEKRIEKRNPFQEELKRWDYGYRVSIGFKRESTTVGLTYSEGLADLNRRETALIRNRTFGLFVTYLFDDMF